MRTRLVSNSVFLFISPPSAFYPNLFPLNALWNPLYLDLQAKGMPCNFSFSKTRSSEKALQKCLTLLFNLSQDTMLKDILQQLPSLDNSPFILFLCKSFPNQLACYLPQLKGSSLISLKNRYLPSSRFSSLKLSNPLSLASLHQLKGSLSNISLSQLPRISHSLQWDPLSSFFFSPLSSLSPKIIIPSKLSLASSLQKKPNKKLLPQKISAAS